MRIRPAIAGSFLLILLVAGLAVPLPGADPTQMHVTPGAARLGDEVSYTLFVRAPGHMGHELSNPVGWAVNGTQRLRLESLAEAPDRDGTMRPSLVVRWEQTDAGGAPWYDAVHPGWQETGPALMREWLDLEARSVWRLDAFGPSGRGPDFFLSFHARGRSQLEGLFLEGQRLVPGVPLDVPRVPESARLLEWQLGYVASDHFGPPPVGGAHILWEVRLVREEGSEPPSAWDVRTLGPATIGDRRVVAVVTRITWPVPTDHAARFPHDGLRTPFAGGSIELTRLAWYADDVPYPILEQERWNGTTDSGEVRIALERARALTQFNRGHEPVPWGRRTTEAIAMERSPRGSHHPADGSGGRLPYPLSQALRDVEASPAATYRAWRALHPEAVLLTAHLALGRNVPGSTEPMWTLIWADRASGRGFEVTSERVAGQPEPVVVERGPRSLDVVRQIDVADAPVSIAAAERLWARAFPDVARAHPPNFVHWGPWVGFNPDPACAKAVMLMPGRVEDAAVLHVGRTNTGTCAIDSKIAWQQAVVVDVQAGSMVGGYDMRMELGYRPAGPADASPFPPSAVAGPASAPPAVRLVLLTSSSLLAALLLVYFYPSIKFAAAKVLVLVPGYSKLARSHVLDHAVRDQIVAAVKAQPGVNPARLARQVRIGWGTLVHHLGVLERHNVLFSVIDGRYRRFFLVGEVPPEDRAKLVALAHPGTRAFFELIQREPGLNQAQLARRLGVRPPNSLWHLRRLEASGLVARRRHGREVRHFPA